ncbi:MAG: S8 family peptidase, partial [Bacteroidales bacterium]
VLNEFQPGVHERALSAAFDATGSVTWYLKNDSYGDRDVSATSSSNLCPAPLDVIPYYAPPEGGKVEMVKITAELISLYDTYSADPSGFEPVSLFIFQFRIPGLSGYPEVMIEVISEPGEYDAMITELNSKGFDLLTEGPSPLKATGWFPIPRLMELNDVISLRQGRPVYPGVSNSYVDPNLGTVTSEGDRAMRGDFARLGFDVDGSGVKIGVISNSYDTKNQAAGNVTSGDLPGVGNPNGYTTPVDVVMDVPPQYGVLSDEGRAMLQIIHDVAPGAELAFRTGYLGANDMAAGIQELVDAGCDIIVEDLSYLDEPYFADGVISQAIDNAVAQGVTFFSSAGNFGPWSIGQQFLEGPDITSIPGKEHDWSGGSGDVFAQVSLEPGTIYTAVLQWDDGSDPTMETTLTDVDFYFTNETGSTVLGFNHVNTGLQPIEVIPFYVDQDTVLANMVVSIASGPDVPVYFKLILFRGGEKFQFVEYGGQGVSTIVGHPNALGTITVGAVRYDKNQVYSPDTYSAPEIMSFSSVGGTPVNGIVRNKPDITAPNGVNTTVELYPGADWSGDADALPNFFGTSAASPHAAAVAALIKEAWAKFEPGTPLTPEDIRTILKTTALDMDAPGDDFISGSGFIQAHQAIMSFANPTPYVTNLFEEEGVLPGESLTPFSFEMTGGYFTDDTEVLMDGEPIPFGVHLQDENSILVDEVSFLGIAGFQASNEPISSSGLDGGVTEVKYFLDPTVRTVLISADDKSKTYGEVMPEFTGDWALITEDDDTLSFAQAVADTLMFQSEADRLSALSYTASADPLSGTGFYSIVPAIDPV